MLYAFSPLPVFHSLRNPLQSVFIHSETFLIKGANNFHITKSKIELQMFFFLVCQQVLSMLTTFSLKYCWLLTSPGSPLLIPLTSLIVNVSGPQGSLTVPSIYSQGFTYHSWHFNDKPDLSHFTLLTTQQLHSFSNRPIRCNRFQVEVPIPLTSSPSTLPLQSC